MAIIPTLRSSDTRGSIAFDTTVAGDTVLVSSHSGDGAFGQAIVVIVDDVDALVHKFTARGLVTPGNPEVPTEVHEGPVDQTWGTREFYVDDPDDNTVRFVQRL